MGLFRRKRRDAEPSDEGTSTEGATGAEAGPASTPEADATAETPARTRPADRSEVENDEGYLDLGAIWMPAIRGLMLTMEMNEQTGDVTAVRVHHADSVLQLQAFAAPRSRGIWDEIRDELVESITGQGGSCDVTDGPFGAEVLARVPGRAQDGRTMVQPMRFVGAEGPRWFLRGVVSGPAATNPELAEPFVELMRLVVVVRGDEPMGPRDLLPLKLPPEEETEHTDVDPGGPENARPASTDELSPFVRGPEITETR